LVNQGDLSIAGAEVDETVFVSVIDTRWLVRVYFNIGQTSDLAVSGCTADFFGVPHRRTVRCERAGVRRVLADLNGGDDAIFGEDLLEEGLPLADRIEANGGTGADALEGGRGDDLLRGESGEDTLRGDRYGRPASDDELLGGSGDDSLTGGLGEDTLAGGGANDVLRGDDPTQSFVDADRLDGGSGRDRVRYTDRVLPLTITLDGLPNDGQLGGAEGDNLIGIENVTGGADEDRVTGNGSGNVLDGLGGRDFLFGLGGDDTLAGGASNDLLRGGDAGDRLEGAGGNDNMFGDDGEDTLIGGDGVDVFNGGGDDDRIYARDNRAETVNCGAGGDDFAQVDVSDTVRNCEQTSRG
jgi:Ca2+-binding RTX toxin-like protein